MKFVDFDVPGEPIPQGSMSAFAYRKKGWQKMRKPKLGVVMVHQNHEDIEDYRERFQKVISQYHDDFFTENSDMAYIVECIFYITKPSSVKRVFPTVRGTGDVDKLLRAVLDALTYTEAKGRKKGNKFGLFKDDSQVIRVVGTKVYTDESVPRPKTRVRITKLLLSNKEEELKKFTSFVQEVFGEKL